MWQEIIVGICVFAATVFLLRHWFFNRQKNACGACSSGCDKKSCDTSSEKEHS